MKSGVARLKNKIKAVRIFTARGGRGYFSNKNKKMPSARPDDLAVMRARNEARRCALEEQAMTSIMRSQRALERLAA